MSTDRGAYPDHEGTMLEEILRATIAPAAPVAGSPVPASPVSPAVIVTPAEGSEMAAQERVRTLAQSWASLPGEGMAADVDRRVGMVLLGMLDSGTAADVALSRVTELAEEWEKPGGPGLFYPAAGQAVLDAIRGASTDEEAAWRSRAESAEAKLAAIAAHCRARMKGPGRSGISLSAATLILGIAEGSDEGTGRE